MKKTIFIRYGELSTKKDNLSFFIKKLNSNIKEKLSGIDCSIISDRVRTYIIPKEDQFDNVTSLLQEVFGIQKIVISYEVDNEIEVIKESALKIIEKQNFSTFKIKTKRANKQFPLDTMQINVEVGSYILDNLSNISVDVHQPDIELNIEIRNNKTFIFLNEILGSGGYPVGIQGKGLLMLSGGIDSPVAGYLALKRGVDLECIYFESIPHTSLEARQKVITLCEKLTKYKKRIKLYIIPFTEIQETIYKTVEESYVITIMRRMMYRIAEQIANKNHNLVIINGESIGQVASQTLTSMQVIESVTKIPIIRPVACLDKLEIIAIAKKIDTYETSILPYEDCCTVFVPKHPAINPKEAKCLEEELHINYDDMLEKALEKTLIINVEDALKNNPLL